MTTLRTKWIADDFSEALRRRGWPPRGHQPSRAKTHRRRRQVDWDGLAPAPTTLALQALGEDRYRISVKRESHGAAGAYIDTRVQAGDILDVSAPRGSFTLCCGGI
jgi:hypothetical protein